MVGGSAFFSSFHLIFFKEIQTKVFFSQLLSVFNFESPVTIAKVGRKKERKQERRVVRLSNTGIFSVYIQMTCLFYLSSLLSRRTE